MRGFCSRVEYFGLSHSMRFPFLFLLDNPVFIVCLDLDHWYYCRCRWDFDVVGIEVRAHWWLFVNFDIHVVGRGFLMVYIGAWWGFDL
jgi:hypothetical protein